MRKMMQYHSILESVIAAYSLASASLRAKIRPVSSASAVPSMSQPAAPGIG